MTKRCCIATILYRFVGNLELKPGQADIENNVSLAGLGLGLSAKPLLFCR